ncbi:MAG: hypothetical protein LBB80_11315 [Treponema sp.]|nr:hypothetical protein [Treponema sp.]
MVKTAVSVEMNGVLEGGSPRENKKYARRHIIAKATDWMPGKRGDQLVMARNWIGIMTAETRAAWNIPQAQFTELEALHTAAAELLQKVMSSERTPVIMEQCKEGFDALTAKKCGSSRTTTFLCRPWPTWTW